MLRLSMAIVVAISASALASRAASTQDQPVCLHGAAETDVNKVRRQAALRLAQTINSAEAFAWSETRRYQPLTGLAPAAIVTPEGFELKLTTDSSGYALSIKDKLDECGYAVMSDQDGVIYNALPFRLR
jgi:hypothetical protein